MPASRNARAMTLAPRSWPSSPGFATSTRIFLSFMFCIVALANELPQRPIGFDERLQLCIREKIAAVRSESLNCVWVARIVKECDAFASYRKIVEIFLSVGQRLLRLARDFQIFSVAVRPAKLLQNLFAF